MKTDEISRNRQWGHRRTTVHHGRNGRLRRVCAWLNERMPDPSPIRLQDTSPLEKGDNLVEDHTSDLQVIDLYAGISRLAVSGYTITT